MTKELLQIEFRYHDDPTGKARIESSSKTIIIGIYDTLEEAIEAGNKILEELAVNFEVRPEDKFKLKHLFGTPCRLVTNCCYPSNGIQYFAKIEQLKFDDLHEMVAETFAAFDRYKIYKIQQNED